MWLGIWFEIFVTLNAAREMEEKFKFLPVVDSKSIWLHFCYSYQVIHLLGLLRSAVNT